MKKFRFRLQTLLNIREAREQEVQNELAGILGIQNRERAQQYQLRQGIEKHSDRFRRKISSGKYTVNEAMLFERFMDVSYRAIDAAEDRVQSMEPVVKEIRGRLVEASREKKVVEKLRERKLDEYNYEMNREIAKEYDDMNQRLYQKKLMEQQ